MFAIRSIRAALGVLPGETLGPMLALAAAVTTLSVFCTISGALFAAGYQVWPLLLCGGLKIFYDLLLLAAFRHIKPPEEKS